MGKAYWGGVPLESYQVSANAAYYQHFDWNLNKRLTTNYAGAVYGEQAELPFGDAFRNVSGSRDNTFDDYAGLWDNGSYMHAQFREYTDMEGRWMQPDPYSGSYDFSNPQSFNRYAYVLNNPLSTIDPSGLEGGGSGGAFACVAAVAEGGSNPWADIGCAAEGIFAWLFSSLFGGPSFHGSLEPRPNTQPWDENHIHFGPDIAGALGLPDAGCEFGACGGIASFSAGTIPFPSIWGETGVGSLARWSPWVLLTWMTLNMTGDSASHTSQVDAVRRDCQYVRTVSEPATARAYKGGTSIEEEYNCSGTFYTIHTIIVNGVAVHGPHIRPGPAKGGASE